ncbi:MAG TPA: deoxyribonuclease IV [Patescibacteria group bacterium]|nr:deoxyribonuclease IV [Patescibacteria group bacterium]
MTKIGTHISSAGDLSLAPQRAKETGCECFQFFSRPPQGGKAKPITTELAKRFKDNMKQYGQAECYIHTPYYINLASANSRIYHSSINIIREELERGSQLGVKYVMTHLGSAKDLGETKGIAKTIKGIAEILKGYQGETQFLIEMSAGAGAIIGDTFEEISNIVNSTKLKTHNIGICFDTAHAFASDYDLRDANSVQDTFKKFDKILGIKQLKLIHANDSKVDLDSKKDRHEHIGQGKIGLSGFKEIVRFAQKHTINMILETPKDGQDLEDIRILKKMRSKL